MALGVATPRDRLDRLVDYGRRALRFWWLMLILAVIGGGGSFMLAKKKPPTYKSWAVLFYQERIQSNILTGGDSEGMSSRAIGDRYRELLMAQGQLAPIINDPELNPFPQELKIDGMDGAVEALRQSISFEVRGINAFRISYSDRNPDRAQKVTAKLTELLQRKEEEMRIDQAQATVAFAEGQRNAAAEALEEANRALNEFLRKHPEFVADNAQGPVAGAAMKALTTSRVVRSSGNPALDSLLRQRARINASLAAEPGQPIVRGPAPKSAERIAAEELVDGAERELNDAQRELDSTLKEVTEKHPRAISAKEKVDDAKRRLRQAQAAVPPDAEPVVIAPTSEADRDELKKQLATIEARINVEQSRAAGTPAPKVSDDKTTDGIVELETTNAKLRNTVKEKEQRLSAYADQYSRAQTDADQQMAEQGARLAVVDPAFKPLKPTGKGKKVMVIAGAMLFFALGGALAVGLAIIDDRLYRRADVEALALAPVLASIPKGGRRRKSGKA